MSKTGRGEQGYALVAAVASIAVFALIALVVIEAGRGAIVSTGAEVDRARAIAAADAGTALALRGLVGGGAADHWQPDGIVHRERFGNADLAIRVEDERGKIPLNSLEEDDARRLFEALGVSGDRLDTVTDSFLDWIDEDDNERDHGAERPYYAPKGIHPRNGPMQSVEEAGLIRGFDPALVVKLREIATVHFGKGSFEPRHASVLAIKIMKGDEEGAVDIINRERELSGQRTALELGKQESLMGRPMTIVSVAKLDNGARAERRMLVELTGSAHPPFIIRESE